MYEQSEYPDGTEFVGYEMAEPFGDTDSKAAPKETFGWDLSARFWLKYRSVDTNSEFKYDIKDTLEDTENNILLAGFKYFKSLQKFAPRLSLEKIELFKVNDYNPYVTHKNQIPYKIINAKEILPFVSPKAYQ